jgi:hypothetical protein
LSNLTLKHCSNFKTSNLNASVAAIANGAAQNLHFLVDVKGIAPHIPVIDKSQRDDGTFSRDDFNYDEARDQYICPSGKILRIPPPL